MGLLDRVKAGWSAFRGGQGAEWKADEPKADEPKAAADTQVDISRNPDRASPVARMSMAGLTPGAWYGDQRNQTSHNRGWPYLALLKLAEQCASATLNVYDASESKVEKAFAPDDHSSETAGLKPIPDHPAAKLLKRPNPKDDLAQFLKRAVFQYGLTGGCVLWEVRDFSGRPVNLYVLPRAWLTFQRPDYRRPLGYYRVNAGFGNVYGWVDGGQIPTTFELDYRATAQFGDPHSLYPGEYYSRLTACAELIDINFLTDTEVRSEMANGMKPGTVFTATDAQALGMTPEQAKEWQAHIEATHAGPDNAGKTLVLAGFSPTPMQPPPDPKVEARQQNHDNMFTLFGVPDIATGRAQDGSYSSHAATMKAFTENTVQPVLDMIGSMFTHRWQPIYGDDYKAELKAKGYDDPDMSAKRSGSILEAAKAGGASWNEWRTSIGLSPRPELDQIQQPQTAGAAPGQPGEVPGGDLGGDSDMDLTPSLDDDDSSPDLGVPTDTTTGIPDASKANMPKAPSWSRQSLNGVH